MENQSKVVYNFLVRRYDLIIDYSEIEDKQKVFKDKKTVLVGGCFDILHYGHLSFLKKASKKGNFLIVALESDDFIKRTKNKNPIHSQRQRAKLLAALKVVDMIILLPYLISHEEYFDLVKKIKPRVIAITENDPMAKNKQMQIDQIGGRLEVVMENLNKFSSKKIYETFFSD
ncbi:MAG: adenylyltransferase/cytidyltransferase family protein [bacterium]